LLKLITRYIRILSIPNDCPINRPFPEGLGSRGCKCGVGEGARGDFGNEKADELAKEEAE